MGMVVLTILAFSLAVEIIVVKMSHSMGLLRMDN
jgi:hypothetical protein